ncbi:MAG: phage tail tube protein [Acidobacteriota bacterium]
MSIIAPASVFQQKVSAVLESAAGTTPASPAYNILPISNGFGMEVVKQFEQASIIRPDLEPGARVGGVSGVEGRIPMAILNEAGFRMWLESGLGGTFTAVAFTIAVAWNSGAKTATRASGSFLTDPIANRFRIGDTVFPAGTASNQSTLSAGIDAVVTTIPVTSITPYNAGGGVVKIASTGEIIKYTAASAGNLTGCTRGWAKTTAAAALSGAVPLPGRTITAISALVLTFSDTGIQTEASVSTTFTANTKILVPGLIRKYFSIENNFQDIATFRRYMGCETNTIQGKIPTSGEATVEFGVLGLQYAITQAASSTYIPTLGSTPAAGSQALSTLLVNGAAFNSCVENIDFNLNNNKARRNGIGSQFACFIGQGKRTMDLNFSVYLVDNVLQGYFQAETRIGLESVAAAAPPAGYTVGDQYRFNWPQLCITKAAAGESQETIAESIQASAEISTATGVNTSFFIHEIGAI